jgi:hypothetical protein
MSEFGKQILLRQQGAKPMPVFSIAARRHRCESVSARGRLVHKKRRLSREFNN